MVWENINYIVKDLHSGIAYISHRLKGAHTLIDIRKISVSTNRYCASSRVNGLNTDLTSFFKSPLPSKTIRDNCYRMNTPERSF